VSDYTEQVKKQILQGETALEEARKLIDKLRAVQEDTTQLEREYQAAKARLERFKAVFK